MSRRGTDELHRHQDDDLKGLKTPRGELITCTTAGEETPPLEPFQRSLLARYFGRETEPQSRAVCAAHRPAQPTGRARRDVGCRRRRA